VSPVQKWGLSVPMKLLMVVINQIMLSLQIAWQLFYFCFYFIINIFKPPEGLGLRCNNPKTAEIRRLLFFTTFLLLRASQEQVFDGRSYSCCWCSCCATSKLVPSHMF
jgi:hypothetical protein